MKYYIAIEEQRSTVVEVEANNYDDALRKVEDAYYENEVCLDDFQYVDDGSQRFVDETEQWLKATELGLTNFIKVK